MQCYLLYGYTLPFITECNYPCLWSGCLVRSPLETFLDMVNNQKDSTERIKTKDCGILMCRVTGTCHCCQHHTPHTSQHTPRTSHLTPRTSHLTPHTSHLAPHTSPHNTPAECISSAIHVPKGKGGLQNCKDPLYEMWIIKIPTSNQASVKEKKKGKSDLWPTWT
jgi:hypothetical protein